MDPKENNPVTVDVDSKEAELQKQTSSVKKRQEKTIKALCDLGLDVTENSAPVIAVMGSGGGLRAMVGLLGTLVKLSELKLLDAATYLCGTSGSTWCMSSLYKNEKWSDASCIKDMESNLIQQLTTSHVDWHFVWKKVKEAYLKDIYSLTNFWAYAVVYNMTKEKGEGCLSSHRAACENGENPYPIYSAVQKDCLEENKKEAWFEFTPYLSGFPAYKLFEKTELIGSEFEDGELTKKHGELELGLLRGIWGSALASDHALKDIIRETFHILLRAIYKEDAAEVSVKGDVRFSMEPQRSFPTSTRSYTENAAEVPVKGDLRFSMEPLRSIPTPERSYRKRSCSGSETIEEFLSQDLTKMTKEEKEKCWNDFAEALEVYSEMPEMPEMPGSQYSREYPLMDFPAFSSFVPDKIRVIKRILDCILHWKWGTINNYRQKDDKAPLISEKKYISLVDAGLEINVAFPLMLQTHRKVDLILSFDFSQGDPFLTLKQTEAYCEKHKIPFPKIIIEKNTDIVDGDIPTKCCYIFKGDDNETPYVLHFPLFNNETCKGKVRHMRETYGTAKMSYTESCVQELLNISKSNVENSKAKIKEEIKDWVERKTEKGGKVVKQEERK